MKATKLRGGLYEVTHGGHVYRIEDIHNGNRWVWRLSALDDYHDPWRGDFATKREALQAI
jgi:hypothetical protein